MSISLHKPQGALRWALKLPIRLYHAGLGGLLGHRFLLLTHKGRKSGRTYETVLEVPYYDKASGRSFVISGWSGNADWFRNIEVQPALRVETSGKTYKPVQHFLTRDEVIRFWPRFRRKHPVEEIIIMRLFSTGDLGASTNAGRRAELIKHARVVSFGPGRGIGQ